jgi:hypothetical protein
MSEINCKHLTDSKNGKMCEILACKEHITAVCPFNCLTSNDAAAEKMCKYYEKVPDEKWALFAVISPKLYINTMTDEVMVLEKENAIRISLTYNSKDLIQDNIPCWMQNVEVRRVE